MSKYKCIIFDCDGVLVDSEPIGNQVLVDMANELGASIDIEYAFKYFKGNSIYDCIKHISSITNRNLTDDFVSEYRKRSYEAFEKQIKPIEGIKSVIQNLDIPFCVASSGPEKKIILNLGLTGLLPYFGGKIFSCYTIQKWKPKPDIFLLAAKTMGFLPEECLVIEDSLTGVEAAKKGGFKVFAYTAHDYNDELSKIADKTFVSMLNLPLLLTEN
ncbi:HAD family hydrolase [Winogradskyella jejuensis]|uniref:Haloacid dehalogenase superfamily, subfamily IA, variant 3 with third motif having DD or ED n=1 Tax=Winogradskyella jejuensis TaxID=1089305 RepID=A0A1M5RGI4_9FLAO|nr:HAD family hydrolase [Winogradskyella jejuensis]SHH25260.1 haloacid dehalogenase superfamily, subfamily IA, variant 3 with third motif having DD or ED [Winogradskyella jejuensis]